MTNYESNTVSVVDTATNTVVATVPVGDGPFGLAVLSAPLVSCTITGAGDIIGTAGNDVICGSTGPDRIAGLGGDDVIFGSGGDDQLSGGDGNDTLHGGAGVDRLSGGPGDDTLNIVEGSGGDYAAGGEHVTGDTCVVDSGDSTALCER